jgi:hypothetical protein
MPVSFSRKILRCWERTSGNLGSSTDESGENQWLPLEEGIGSSALTVPHFIPADGTALKDWYIVGIQHWEKHDAAGHY